MIIENVIIVVIDSTGRKAILVLILGGGVEIPPTFVPSGGGEISWGGEFSPLSGTVRGGEFSPLGMISLPLEKLFTKIV